MIRAPTAVSDHLTSALTSKVADMRESRLASACVFYPHELNEMAEELNLCAKPGETPEKREERAAAIIRNRMLMWNAVPTAA
jgi:hypothetical protein